MTNDELLAKAIERLRFLETRRTIVPIRLKNVKVDLLPKRSIRDAVVVDFKSDTSDARIQMFLDRESGEVIATTYFPDDHPKTIA